MRKMLQKIGLESFPKTSGGKGLHFYVPLNTPVTFEQTKNFSRAVAESMEKRLPDKVVSKMAKALRVGKVFVDWSQNNEHKTTVCVYSLRAKDRPTVSAPVTWAEVRKALANKDASILDIDSEKAIERATRRGDLFKDVLEMKQELPNVGEI
jgi:bifunctional non-homologous end joining protein LigD